MTDVTAQHAQWFAIVWSDLATGESAICEAENNTCYLAFRTWDDALLYASNASAEAIARGHYSRYAPITGPSGLAPVFSAMNDERENKPLHPAIWGREKAEREARAAMPRYRLIVRGEAWGTKGVIHEMVDVMPQLLDALDFHGYRLGETFCSQKIIAIEICAV